jgi:hypothetical protein
MEWQPVVIWALGALVTGQVAILKMLWTKTESNQKEISASRQHIAENYLTRVEHTRLQERIEDKLDSIITKLDKKADK